VATDAPVAVTEVTAPEVEDEVAVPATSDDGSHRNRTRGGDDHGDDD
jgi:hypothetical protein